MITLNEIKELAGFLQLLGGVAVFVVALWAKSNFVPRSEAKTSAEAVDKRVAAVEQSVAACATRDQLVALTAQLSELQADGREARTRLEALNDRLDERLGTIRDAVRRIEDHLLSKTL